MSDSDSSYERAKEKKKKSKHKKSKREDNNTSSVSFGGGNSESFSSPEADKKKKEKHKSKKEKHKKSKHKKSRRRDTSSSEDNDDQGNHVQSFGSWGQPPPGSQQQSFQHQQSQQQTYGQSVQRPWGQEFLRAHFNNSGPPSGQGGQQQEQQFNSQQQHDPNRQHYLQQYNDQVQQYQQQQYGGGYYGQSSILQSSCACTPRSIWDGYNAILGIAMLCMSIALLIVVGTNDTGPENEIFCPTYQNVTDRTALKEDAGGLIENVGIVSWGNVHGAMGLVQWGLVFMLLFLLLKCPENTCFVIITAVIAVLNSLFRFAWIVVGSSLYFGNCDGMVEPQVVNDTVMAAVILGFIELGTFALGLCVNRAYPRQ